MDCVWLSARAPKPAIAAVSIPTALRVAVILRSAGTTAMKPGSEWGFKTKTPRNALRGVSVLYGGLCDPAPLVLKRLSVAPVQCTENGIGVSGDVAREVHSRIGCG